MAENSLISIYIRSMGEFFGRFFLPFKTIERVDDKAVFITGCDTGFGHLMALNLNESGFLVFAACLFPDQDNAQGLLKKCKNVENMILLKLDVTKEEEILSARAIVMKELEKRSHSKFVRTQSQSIETDSGFNQDANANTQDANFQDANFQDANSNERLESERPKKMKLWALINNAGIGVMGEFEWGSFDAQIRRVLEVNTLGPAFVTRTFLPLIRESRGRIININSQASRYSAPGMCPYAMSKHASLALTESLRREMFKFGVIVISIEPFFYPTEIVNRSLTIKKAQECWRATDQEIKDAYGEPYYQKIMKMYDGVDSEGGASNDPIQVALEVNHAVTSAFPKYNYAVASIWMKIILWLGLFVNPQDVVELLWKITLHFSGFDRVYPNTDGVEGGNGATNVGHDQVRDGDAQDGAREENCDHEKNS